MSSWTPPRRAHCVSRHVDTAPLTVTLVVDRDAMSTPTARAQALATVFQHAADHGLEVVEVSLARGVTRVKGSPAAMEDAFQVELHRYQSIDNAHEFTATNTNPTLPPGISAVLGLDKRPVVSPYFHPAAARAVDPAVAFTTHNNLYNPVDLGHLYQFPAGTTGKGQTIAIIEFGGGYSEESLANYFHGLGLPVPNVQSVGLLGASNSVGSDADGEVQLDIEVAGALAPDALYMVYFAPNTDEGFHEAISQAIHHPTHPATVISISWGGPENIWSTASLGATHSAILEATNKGIPVTVAAGDNGAGDGESGLHCDFPCSSPAAIACGGTRLIASAEAISNESVWNDTDGNGATGGGVSQFFPLPTWQANRQVPLNPSGKPGRGVPDVAGVADPETGYYVVVNDQPTIVGGTSAVAPLWAALIARVQESLGKPLVNLNQTLYSLPAATFRDITHGNNDGYQAASGWDPTTGLGSPNGEALLAALKAL